MGLLGLVGSIFGGNSAKKAAEKAAQAQIEAARIATDEQRRQFDITQGNLKPWLTAGQTALDEQLGILGLGPQGREGQAASIAALKDSPLYSSIYDNGVEAILANASATGGLRGGNTQNSLARFGGDTLSSVLGNYLAQLGGLSGTGNQTGTNLGGMGANMADRIGALTVGAGNAQAGSYLAQGQINQNMWNNIGSFLDGDDFLRTIGKIGKAIF